MSLILCLDSYHTMSLKGKDIGCGEWEGMVGGGGEGNVSEVWRAKMYIVVPGLKGLVREFWCKFVIWNIGETCW